MVNAIGTGDGGLAREAFEAAIKRKAAELKSLEAKIAGFTAEKSESASPFKDLVAKGIVETENAVQKTDALPVDVLQGKLDFHEVAAQLKESQLAFQFTLEVRNKFIDAYREVMRMSV